MGLFKNVNKLVHKDVIKQNIEHEIDYTEGVDLILR